MQHIQSAGAFQYKNAHLVGSIPVQNVQTAGTFQCKNIHLVQSGAVAAAMQQFQRGAKLAPLLHPLVPDKAQLRVCQGHFANVVTPRVPPFGRIGLQDGKNEQQQDG